MKKATCKNNYVYKRVPIYVPADVVDLYKETYAEPQITFMNVK